MRKTFTISFVLFIMLSVTKAQITFTSADIENYYKTNQTSYTDTTVRTINIGAPGANNTWDFSFLEPHIARSFVSVTPSSSPYIGDFPTANFVLKTQVDNDGQMTDFFTYAILKSDSYVVLGAKMEFTYQTMPIKTKMENSPGNKSMIFPLTYNTQWTDQYSYSVSSLMNTIPINSYTETHTTIYKVDAYGTLKMPGGKSASAIRLKEDDRYVNTKYNTSDRSVSYSIMTQAGYSVSFEVDTNAASSGNIIVSGIDWKGVGVTGVNEVALPADFSLSQNYPNPFNPSTSIEFQMPKSGYVTLKVYDSMGKEVSTLFSGNASAGTHKVFFDASNLSSGMYFYRLQSGELSMTKKAILIK